MSRESNVIEILRKIQLEWELDGERFAKMIHTDSKTLEKYLKMKSDEIEKLPLVPSGLESAMALVSVYKNLKRLIPDVDQQNEWLMASNPFFDGHRPIEVMAMSPEHLSWVSYTLESQMLHSGHSR